MVIFLTKSQNLTREKKSTIFNKISKFLVRKGSIFSKNQLAKSIIFWTFLDRFPPNNGQKPLKIFARFARKILGSQKISARFAREVLFLTKSQNFARFAREVLFLTKSHFFSRASRARFYYFQNPPEKVTHMVTPRGGVNIKHSGIVAKHFRAGEWITEAALP